MLAGGDFERINGFRERCRAEEEDRPLLSKGLADFLTAVSNVIFAVALLPTVTAGTILPPLSSAATLGALLLLGVVLANFKLWWGLFWNIICAGMWATLLVMAL